MYYLEISEDEFYNLQRGGTVTKEIIINTKSNNLNSFKKKTALLVGITKNNSSKAIIISKVFVEQYNRLFKKFRIAFIRL